MRIDIDRFPDLFKDWSKLKFDDKSIFLDRSVFIGSITKALKNLYFITAPVVSAAYLSLKKIHHLLNEIPEVSRTLLVSNGERNWVYCYSIIKKEIDGNPSIMVCGFVSDSKSDPVPLPFYIHTEDVNERYKPFRYYGLIKQEEINEYTPILGFITCMEVFLNFAEVQTKVLPPNEKIFEGVTCLYNNKTKNPVKIIDSLWFTNLIKSGAFKVRGHFRLQPFGEGLKERKLIWISEFQKEGYTRVAGKDKDGE